LKPHLLIFSVAEVIFLPIEIVISVDDRVMNRLKKKGIDESILKKDLEEVVKVIDKVKPSRVKKEAGS